jgi:CARDB
MTNTVHVRQIGGKNDGRWPTPTHGLRTLMALAMIVVLLGGCGGSSGGGTGGSSGGGTGGSSSGGGRQELKQPPDLRITDVRVDPKPIVVAGMDTIVRGTTYSFTLEVSNVGQGSVPGAVAVSIGYGCQGPGLGGTSSVTALGPIGPGEKQLTSPAFSLTIPADRLPGTCSFRFEVDPSNLYQESDESNMREMTVSVN